MSRRKKRKKFRKPHGGERREGGRFALPEETKQGVWGVLLILAAIIIGLSFFEKAGVAGQFFMRGSRSLIGEAIFIIPLILILGGLVFLGVRYNFREKRTFWPVVLAILILILGATGILGTFNPQIKRGGWLGYVLSWPFLRYFGFWATLIIFLALIIIGILIFWQFLRGPQKKEDFKPTPPGIEPLPQRSLIKKIFAPRFKVKEVPPFLQQKEMKELEKQPSPLNLETKSITGAKIPLFQPPPLDLLEKERGAPTSGDTRINSAIIKKTLQNFSIEVAMSEVNIGPTVTQYTLKPAEGIKLSKITALSNDLALALASHPIRIEAPIPGRPLVGIEVPNKVRAQVRLRDLIENPNFQRPTPHLTIVLGKDVAGFPVYTDLTRMPHLLVAGSTGTGKTIFLNSLILSLLYQPSAPVKSASPETLRFILIDPKRVEFSVYKNLPNLLCPVVYSATQTINVLKWLTQEMERRFDVLSEAKARDIGKFNEMALSNGSKESLPFIVLIIDELADLMAAKGREIETGVVRLAQMARAVGIHLVVATQRPSVEVITGLIKANITSRITFQVASQVDSRTVLDTAGAEKLLGLGDMLYISAQTPRPKRIQGPYVSEKEIKKVMNHVKLKSESLEFKAEMDSQLLQEMEKGLGGPGGGFETFYGGEDPLYEEAKRVVIEARRASASLLQRRLRIGYARAARLVDMLEEKGVVGPGEGAKPREVYGKVESEGQENPEGEDEWEKI